MKRVILIFLIASILFSMISCGTEVDAESLLQDFLSTYGACGVVYSPHKSEGEDGYISEALIEKIYVCEGDFPKNFAVFLNSRADYGAECAVFVCRDEYESAKIIEMCRERIKVLGKSEDNATIYRSGNIIFYSTFEDVENVNKLWIKNIKTHT